MNLEIWAAMWKLAALCVAILVYTIDITSWAMELITAIKDIITTFVALAGLWIAYRGLTTWQRQLRGNTDFDLARRILRATYEVRDRVEILRNPWILPWESGQYQEKDDSESTAFERHQKAVQNTYIARWDQVQSARVELDALKTEAEAYWGAETRQSILGVLGLTQEIFVNLGKYLTHLNEKARTDKEADRFDKWASIVQQQEENDEFSTRMANAVKRVELLLLPSLGRKIDEASGN